MPRGQAGGDGQAHHARADHGDTGVGHGGDRSTALIVDSQPGASDDRPVTPPAKTVVHYKDGKILKGFTSDFLHVPAEPVVNFVRLNRQQFFEDQQRQLRLARRRRPVCNSSSILSFKPSHPIRDFHHEAACAFG